MLRHNWKLAESRSCWCYKLKSYSDQPIYHFTNLGIFFVGLLFFFGSNTVMKFHLLFLGFLFKLHLSSLSIVNFTISLNLYRTTCWTLSCDFTYIWFHYPSIGIERICFFLKICRISKEQNDQILNSITVDDIKQILNYIFQRVRVFNS